MIGNKPKSSEMSGLTSKPRARKMDDMRAQWISEQEALKRRLSEQDPWRWLITCDAPGEHDSSSLARPLTRVAGVDISFLKGSTEHACASIVVLAYLSMDVLYEAYTYVSMPAPYIPGFLAFREVHALTKLYDDLVERCPQCAPDVILVDGNGVLHPRGFGLASHFGVLRGIPTIGVGKTFFHVDGLTKPSVKALMERTRNAGEQVAKVVGVSGRVWAAAICGPSGVTNPIYVSVGHLTSIDTAIAITLACTRQFRVPEPIRQADLRSRVVIREWEQRGASVDTTLNRFTVYSSHDGPITK